MSSFLQQILIRPITHLKRVDFIFSTHRPNGFLQDKNQLKQSNQLNQLNQSNQLNQLNADTTLGYGLLIYMCIMVVVLTLVPFDFRVPDTIRLSLMPNLTDFTSNIILFVPVGFLFRLSRRKYRDPFCLMALAFGVLLSLAIESVQIFISSRYPQLSDIITNALGAWLGAILFMVLKRQLRQKQPFKVFALELPLMNLIYLLIPLMWLNGLATGKEGSRLWLLLLLGLLGSGVLLWIYKSRFTQTLRFSPNKLSLFAVGWFFTAAIPAMLNFPRQILAFGILIGLLVQIPARTPRRAKHVERRFELRALKMLLPLYAVYLLFLAGWPTTLPIEQWQFNINFEQLTFNEKIVFIFRFAEYLAAFTLLGYMVAEMRGRKNEALEKTLGWTFFISVAAAIFIQVLKTYPALNRINILPIIIITAASLYGAVIYRLQLSAIEHRDF
jgi:glycopeptide antibiotics resistance protein